MAIKILETAEKELEKMDKPLNRQFGKHIEKLALKENAKHLTHGIPCFVENVTKQARIIYHIENEIVYIMHCFKSHKEYERWYKSFK